jgi:MFS transporter, DHA1 family, multidrug resistance protein
LSLAAIGLIAVTYVKVPETNLARTSSLSFGTMIRDFGKLIREPDFLGFTLCSSLSMGAFFSYIGGVPYVSAFVMGMTPIEYGLWFASMAFGYSAGSFLSCRYAERLGVARMILLGTALAVVGVGLAILFALLGIKSPPALFLPMSLMGVANGLSLPSAISGAISVRPEIAGAASGLSGTAQISTGAILSTISGAVLVGATTALPMLWLIFAASAGSFLVALQIFLRGR